MLTLRIPLFLMLGILIAPGKGAAQERSASLLPRVDHLVYATPDLDRGIDEIEKLLGVRASPGGQHQGRGTRNALVALGPTAYLEIERASALRSRRAQ
jgi:hypothetical protein